MLTYDRGDPRHPRGHALVYVRDVADPDRLAASYVVVPPIAMDFAKYVPPMFAGQFEHLIPQGPTAFPLPPVPEAVPGYDYLARLAEARDDDLIDGGRVAFTDVPRMMAAIGEIAAQYTQAHTDYVASLATAAEEPAIGDGSGLDADEILLDVMTEAEKVERLAKLTGTLHYAAGGRDEPLMRETILAMRKIGRRLPEHYQVEQLIQVAGSTEPPAGQLVALYVERCYTLARQDFAAVADLEARIRATEGGADRP